MLLYPNRPDLIRLCRALGFGAPVELSGASNSNLASLQHVISVYHAQTVALLKDHDEKTAISIARKFMQDFEFNGQPLGEARARDGLWMYCGLEGDEDCVPDEHKSDFCGGCFHLACAGLITKPKATGGRLACMHCLSDRRYRPKLAPSARLQRLAMYRPNRDLRMLKLDADTVPTLKLVCSCKANIGSGIPCAGMLAVAQSVGAVLHYSCIHRHWLSHSIVNVVQGDAAFEGNEALVLNVAAVAKEISPQIPPSTLKVGMTEPRGVTVRPSKRATTTH